MRTAVVVCPGRGTYNKTELGYLGAHFPDAAMLAAFDDHRRAEGQPLLTELDGATRFSASTHTRGSSFTVIALASSFLLSAGSSPCATPARKTFACLRAISGVQMP